ncbi:hypothetical protein CEUSTIGMA_g3548.t1 [Chlamydomonas eustigma]|uniref:Uncharacterized protein n=1 Tax=Chlamydomonas eustigma TaxID=1157962 RepID=A0A250WZ96_9CHLO|nr:hypothetical protein CEUSTIGMA_g3548.t1 [Chlamydomonas eustigma]|eukprot:GAX76105.1 hypothetical protein CEUSTIGMA_g3548.t1 [Chlamydomonas eustigma]
MFSANAAGALASNLHLGSAVASGIKTLGTSTEATAMTVITALEQQMSTLKALTTNILDAHSNIQNTLRSDLQSSSLNFLFNPLQTIQQNAVSIDGIVANDLSKVRTAVAGMARLAGDTVAGIPALLQSTASFAATLVKPPAAVASNVLQGSLGTVSALQQAVSAAGSTLTGNKGLQVGLKAFNGQLGVMQNSLQALNTVLDGWQGFDASVVNAASALVTSWAGNAGTKVGSLVSNLSPLVGGSEGPLSAALSNLGSLKTALGIPSSVLAYASG